MHSIIVWATRKPS